MCVCAMHTTVHQIATMYTSSINHKRLPSRLLVDEIDLHNLKRQNHLILQQKKIDLHLCESSTLDCHRYMNSTVRVSTAFAIKNIAKLN